MTATHPGDDVALHTRVLEGDHTASADIFERHLTPVIERLSRRERFRGVAGRRPEMIWDAVSDAIFAYLANPATYQPGRSTLMAFLTMSAHGDLLNALAREKREGGRQESMGGPVELHAFAGNIPSAAPPLDLRLEEDEIWRRITEIVTDERDQAVVRLMLDGERNRDEYARLLQITDWPDDERKREVDRVKDRIKKRIQRAGRARIGDL